MDIVQGLFMEVYVRQDLTECVILSFQTWSFKCGHDCGMCGLTIMPLSSLHRCRNASWTTTLISGGVDLPCHGQPGGHHWQLSPAVIDVGDNRRPTGYYEGRSDGASLDPVLTDRYPQRKSSACRSAFSDT